MPGSFKRPFGPLALTTTLTANIYQGGNAGASTSVYDIIKHIHVVNKTGAAVTLTLYLGATGGNAAGTELFTGLSIPANSYMDYYCNLKMTTTDFLVGGASANTALTIYGEGEQFAV